MRRRAVSPAPPTSSVPASSSILEDQGQVHGIQAVNDAATPREHSDAIPIKPDTTTTATASSNTTTSNATTATGGLPEKDGERQQRLAAMFECNICFDTPRDPIVTRCGHLYCWGCVYRWMRQRAGGASQCPVCKASISPEAVVPIYGRGRTTTTSSSTDKSAPPRPSGQRTTTTTAAGGIPNANNNAAAGIPDANGALHPYWHPAAAFGRNVYAAGHGGNLALATFGNFPSLFGMEIAYPQLNEQADNHPRLTPEQETREQVAKVFLFLALFIIGIITFF